GTTTRSDSPYGLFSPTYFDLGGSARYLAALLICLFFSASAAFAQSTYYLWTGQTAAQTQIDSFHTSSWYIHVLNGPVPMGGGNFTMKAGSSATANVTLTLYQGSSTAGSIVASVTLRR